MVGCLHQTVVVCLFEPCMLYGLVFPSEESDCYSEITVLSLEMVHSWPGLPSHDSNSNGCPTELTASHLHAVYLWDCNL